MNPPHKQPAVTMADVDACCEEGLRTLSRNLLTERDEAIREVERLRSLPIMDASRCYHGDESIVVCNLKVALESEKRRAAAYREVAIKFRTLWGEGHEAVGHYAKMPGKVDAEAHKLLADSGGEKEKSE